jgi:hypothetical protein
MTSAAALQQDAENLSGVSFQGAAGDDESRMFITIRRARFFAEFTLSRARSFAALRMTAKGSE